MKSEMRGNVWKFGDNVDTDHISPSRYSMLKEYSEMAAHAFADMRPEFASQCQKGDIIVAGKNFGCGSSRQRAPLVIKYCGVSCIIAESFARIFLRNSVNMGFPMLELPNASKLIDEHDNISVNMEKGEIINNTKKEVYYFNPIPEFMMNIYRAGGLDGYIINRLKEEEK